VTSWPDSASAERDRGLERLRKLTIACFAGAAGMVVFLSVMAATNIPGHASNTPSNANPGLGGGLSQNPIQNQNQNHSQNQPQDQNPFAGFFGGGGGGSPIAVSGGSAP